MSREDTQFKTGAKQVEIARAGGIASGVAKRQKKAMREMIVEKFRNGEPLTAECEELFAQLLLSAPQAVLEEIATDKELPVYIRRRARLMMSKDDEKAVDMIERVLDRAFGKPKQKTEMDARLKDMQPVVVADFGIKKK